MRTKPTAAFAVQFFVLILIFFHSRCVNSLPKHETLNSVEKWFILLDYSPADIPHSLLQNYDMAILDPDHHPPLDSLDSKTILIAYVSMGEAEAYRSYWKDIKDKTWIIGENPNWQGNYYVDVRSEEWKGIIIDEVIPGVIDEGFEGIFMDTLDVPSMLEGSSLSKYTGSDRAMVDLIRAIHDRYPQLLLISNNGFSILEEIAPFLSGILVEDIHMMVDFDKGGYKKVPESERQHKITILTRLMKQYDMPVFVIDYVPENAKSVVRHCIEQSRRLGFKPYVAEGALDRIYEN